jgi:hypothetical protein
MDILMAAMLALAGPDDVVLTGEVDQRLGSWVLRVDGVSYDLHDVPADLRDGEWIQVVGTVLRKRVCVHMTGIVLRVRSIQRVL